MAGVTKEDCDSRHDELIKSFGEVRDAVMTHLGEHTGEEKAEAKHTSKVRRMGVYIAAAIGALSLLGASAMGCIKIVQLLNGDGG